MNQSAVLKLKLAFEELVSSLKLPHFLVIFLILIDLFLGGIIVDKHQIVDVKSANIAKNLEDVRNIFKIVPTPKPTPAPSNKPNATPTPTPTTNNQPTSSNSTSNSSTSNSSGNSGIPTQTPASNTNTSSSTNSTGFSVNLSSVDLTIEDGKSAKAFDLTSTGATYFKLGYPSNLNSGIRWLPDNGNISPGQTVSIYIKVDSGTNPGIYSGTADIKEKNDTLVSIPVKVTAVRTPSSKYIKITYPNGGETFKKGSDKVTIAWEGNGEWRSCFIYSMNSAGSLSSIAEVTANGGGSYEWDANVGNTSSTQFKIDMLCYLKEYALSVSDQSDNFFTVNP